MIGDVGKYPTTQRSGQDDAVKPAFNSVSTKHSIVLASVLRVMRPLVRLLLRNGITYTAFANALKRVFLDAATAELASQGMARTDSAVTLLSGIHRRDVRLLSRGAAIHATAAVDTAHPPLSLAGEVVAHWMSDADSLDAQGLPRVLPRSADGLPPDLLSFDGLVARVSSDVRPRAMLDELLRLGAVTESDAGIAMVGGGFAPRQGLAEMASLLADNLGDHAAAAAANLQDSRNFLEQAIYVDEITAESAELLQKVAAQAWRQAFQTVMREAQQRFDADALQVPVAQRRHRARFGAYFYSEAPQELKP